MHIRTVLVRNLIEAALDQRNPSRSLKGALNALLFETNHRDRDQRQFGGPLGVPPIPRRRLKVAALRKHLR